MYIVVLWHSGVVTSVDTHNTVTMNVLFVHSMCYLCIQCVTYAFNVLIVQLFYIDMFYNTGLLEYLCGK